MYRYMYVDLCNLFRGLCYSQETLRDYEERLLDKCFDHNYDIALGSSEIQCYEPPFAASVPNIVNNI